MPQVRIEWLYSVESTNAEALSRAAGGETGPLWIVAGQQTGGRGRNGRTWISAPGNLYASLLLSFARSLPNIAQLSLVAGLAVHDGIAGLAQKLPLQLKWPNDLLIGDAKLAGILIEGRMAAGSVAHNVVVGIGVNLAHHPTLEGRRTTSLNAHGVSAQPATALDHVSDAFHHWRDVWAEGAGFAAVRQAWMARAVPVGTPVSVHTGAERLEGRFLGLEADGAMTLGLEAGRQRRISFGDVHIGAPPGADD